MRKIPYREANSSDDCAAPTARRPQSSAKCVRRRVATSWLIAHTLWLIACTLAVGSGCARSRGDLQAARQAFASGDLVSARGTLQTLADESRSSQLPAELDLAIVELASGDPQSAESRLRGLRDRFDEQPKVKLVHETASMVADDTLRPFRPAGYEEVMIRAMLAVCSLASDQVDAESYTLQATMRQSELAREAEQRGIAPTSSIFQPIAMAPYLRGMLREATHRDYDDAERAYRLVSDVRPQFSPATADLARVTQGQHSKPGHGVLYVLACVGRGPILRETVAETTTQSLAIASAVLNSKSNERENDDEQDEDGLALPNIASVKIPQVIIPDDKVAAVGVAVAGHLRGATQTLTDIGELAITQVESEQPWTIARAVVRRTMKEVAVAKAGDSMGLDGTAGSLFHFAAASAWSGLENADTRCWGLLPREIQVFRIELPIGEHDVELMPLAHDGSPIPLTQRQRIAIDDGHNTYLIAMTTDQSLYVVSSER